MKAPIPETRRALLVNRHGRPTWHNYLNTLWSNDQTCWCFYFQCEETNIIRQWGNREVVQ